MDHQTLSLTVRDGRQSDQNEVGTQLRREIEFQRGCMSSADAAAASAAFAQKRKPVFGRSS